MSVQVDILVLGATGFTGRLVTKHLNAHRDRKIFTFALAARSRSKLATLATELDLSVQIPLLTVDVTNADQVENAVKNAKVVINTVGPYWLWGTPVVRACARNGIHYVDLTGETAWIKEIIHQFDYLASKTRAVIVPSCGFDSIPSDLSAYLSIRTLKEHLGSGVEAGRSVTAHKIKSGVSGGTLSSMYTYLAVIPPEKAMASLQDHSLSPSHGAPSPPHKLLYSMPHISPPIFGGFFIMSIINRNVVLRTRGLLEIEPSMSANIYGPHFTYEEFSVTPNRLAGILLSAVVFAVSLCLGRSKLARWFFKRFIVDNVHGPSDEAMERGFLKATNVTSSVPTLLHPETHAKTTIRVRGDPGYLCATVMITECAIALLDTSQLTPLAKKGGVLTSVTAFGDKLVKRLEDSGRFEFDTSIVSS
ncbi:hypothetical protein K439DRAFT_1405631 [Ramaria rubella]|nr:hypothetical protein K439DRAFT_1405631 [Ramaria rubella]